ncbi:hypothetical protein D1610_11745 [Sphingomonas gilva]|uniref:Putative tail fiber protein gp53-like C-terminal domain-containing protein n=1 Tax=Sphingomonas gilva TaxID=2305907 RepID=A0A396S1G0_9SPHN|nr:hypothetical protein [Sphingomonas gilva]RHW17215.1 hypothetical protein D1610_11745 [Sphingomonas gilva]
MHKIDGPGSVNGAFSEGNPAQGQRATKVTADWLNDIQDNVLHVLTEAGVDPTKGRAADLLDAIDQRIINVGGGTGEGVPTARTISASGLATGGGDLTADRTITVPKASPAEVAAGTDDTKAITPLALAESISGTLTSEGSAEMPGGLIIKWGGVRGNYSQGPVYKQFLADGQASPFPNACLRVTATSVNSSSVGNKDIGAQIVDYDAAGVTIYMQDPGTALNTINGFDYIAIGW